MAQVAPAAPITNRLLDRLPVKDRAHLLSRCERVKLSFPKVLAEPGQPIRHAYFPTGSLISLLAPKNGRASLEVGRAGSEGMYGVGLALGVEFSPVHALVQGSGTSWRIGAAAFRGELARSTALRKSVNRYIFVLMNQFMQSARCSRFCVIEQRLARLLLTTADRVHSTTFRVTHEFLAYLLGMRREGITQAAGALQRRKLISYSRGAVAILDREGLERVACSCYQSDNLSYQRIFG